MVKPFESPRPSAHAAMDLKRSAIVVGLMSGTSADGVDAAVVRIARGSGRPRLLAFRTFPYPGRLRDMILRNSDPRTARLDEVSTLNFLVAEFFADAAIRLLRSARVPRSRVDAIGSHGQTIGHYPGMKTLFGRKIRSTLQIGHPAVIAKRTGITTVGDFRVGDIALGGSGAPLVPLCDHLLHRSPGHATALLNIGGIANLTALPADARPAKIIAFDTGPGNMAIDLLMRKLYDRPFDRGGRVAAAGMIAPNLLRRLAADAYLRIPPPKSTGREMFGERFVSGILRSRGAIADQDIIATVTEFTALSVYLSYLRHVRKKVRIGRLIVSGGGSENAFLMDCLGRYFSPVPVVRAGDDGIPAGAKEAVCFGVLGLRTLLGEPGNVPAATGASRPGILGVICPP